MRRWQFSLRTLLFVMTIAAMLLAIGAETFRRIYRVWESATYGTMCVRVTSDGTVKCGEELSMQECARLLTREAQKIRSAGVKPALLIEAYSNTKQSDVESVAEIGRKAGFEKVETDQLGWPDNLAE